LKFKTSSEGTLQFNVVSFFYIPGRNFTFYGVNHVANVLADGSVEVYPISSSNGARSIDENKRDTSTEVSATGLTLDTNGFYDINQCSDLLLMTETGNYQLTANLECTLLQPLFSSPGQAFKGTLNGNGNTITVSINSVGAAALFGTLDQATIINLLVRGDITGVQNCGGVSVTTLVGTNFVSTGVYASISCSNNGNEATTIGGFASILRNPNHIRSSVNWLNSVSQSNFTLSLSDDSLPNFQGGFYGMALEHLGTKFNFSYSASIPTIHGSSYKVDAFGFKVSDASNTKSNTHKKDVYIPDDCYNCNETDIRYINMCVQFYEENAYENQDCCTYFNSCPYVDCNNYSQVCMGCRHNKKKENILEIGGDNFKRSDSSPEIIPTTKNLCSST